MKTHDNPMFFHSDTPDEVKAILTTSKASGKRLFLRYGDTKTGRDWLEEHEVEGRISTSQGPIRVPIILNKESSRYGGSVLDNCIVAIRETTGDRRFLYKHALYHTGKFEVGPPHPEDENAGYAAAVRVDGSVHAQFKKRSQAEKWKAKYEYKGERSDG